MIEKGTAVGCPFEIVKKACHCEEEHRPDVQSVTPVPWPPCERPIPLIKGKCPEGTKGIGLAVSLDQILLRFYHRTGEIAKFDFYL